MEHSSRVYVQICGKGFNMVSDERPEYMRAIAEEIDERMGKLIRSNSRITYDTAAVLTALNLLDELKQEKLQNRITVDKNAVDALEKKLSAAESSIAELKKRLADEQEQHLKEMEKLRLEWVLKEKEFLDMIEECGE